MTNEYINSIYKKKQKRQVLENIIFGQTLGLILIIVGVIIYLDSDIEKSKWLIYIITTLGSVLLILGVIIPGSLYYPNKLFKAFTNKVFGLILNVLLIIIYIVLIIPVGLISKKKYQNMYRFYKWNRSYDKSMLGFQTKKVYINVNNQNKRRSKIHILKDVINYLYLNKDFILIPAVFLLLLIGIILFFITSTVISPIIYTLF